MKLGHSLLCLLLLGVSAVLASARTTVVRGPYLQSATPTGVVIRWRTDIAEPSVVKYGLAPDQLTMTATSRGFLTEHIVQLDGLQPATRYYYAVGASVEKPLRLGESYQFTTSPPVGPARPVRAWLLGDSGTNNVHQRAVRDAALAHMGQHPADLVLMLGDNAYPDGTDAEHQAAIFDMYAETLRRTPLWPTLGNHDARTANSITQSGVYYDVFTLPTRGQAGGLASGTESYYSFDYANIHFVCLDSHDTDRSAEGAMASWLKADLAATKQEWIIAFFHHPPYTHGSHNSDTENDPRMREMRMNFLPLLEQGGVDLVFTGHSHAYERSRLLDGHYEMSDTFDAARHVVQPGDGRPDGNGAYRKLSGRAPRAGHVSIVAGSSGQVSPKGNLDHPAMFISLRELGSVILDIDGAELNLAFINDRGEKRDWFTIVKK